MKPGEYNLLLSLVVLWFLKWQIWAHHNLLNSKFYSFFSIKAHSLAGNHFVIFWQPRVKGRLEPPGFELRIHRFPAWCLDLSGTVTPKVTILFYVLTCWFVGRPPCLKASVCNRTVSSQSYSHVVGTAGDRIWNGTATTSIVWSWKSSRPHVKRLRGTANLKGKNSSFEMKFKINILLHLTIR